MAQQADRQIRHGFELASRGAMFAARAEFIAALRLVAQGLDTEHQTTVCSRALSAGLTALREANDFIPAGARLEADLDLRAIVVAHRTPLLKEQPGNVQPADALKHYFTFAQEQLAAAAGQEVSGSMALCALGKLHAALARQKSRDLPACEPKAVVFFQAALLAHPQNYLASNELGVLLAQCGNPASARPMLEHSVSICRASANLGNLATVHQQLGNLPVAGRIRQQAELARQAEVARMKAAQSSAGGAVQWVGPDVLARSPGQPVEVPMRPSANSPSPMSNQPSPAGRLVTSPSNTRQPSANDFSAPPVKKPTMSWLPFSPSQR